MSPARRWRLTRTLLIVTLIIAFILLVTGSPIEGIG